MRFQKSITESIFDTYPVNMSVMPGETAIDRKKGFVPISLAKSSIATLSPTIS